MAAKSRKTRRRTAKRRVAAKARAGRSSNSKKKVTKRPIIAKTKTTTSSSPGKKVTKHPVVAEAKAGTSRSFGKKVTTPPVVAKAKTSTSRSSGKKVMRHPVVKVSASKRRTKTRVTKRNIKKAATTRKVASRQKVSKVSRTAPKSIVTSEKTDFDFNSWLLPTLALERYEPQVAEEVGVRDNIKGSTRYAWIGAGQCGGRIAKSFYDLGYKKVLVVNTTHHDLDLLEIPQNQKFLMDIGEKGAGKEMERGSAAVQQYQQEILHLCRQTFGTQVDHIMVCFGAGGGTGGGSATRLIEIAKRYARYIGLDSPDKRVGAIMTLPTVGEASSPLVARNAHDVACELSQMATKGEISPLIIIDNEKINKLYPGMTVKSFWASINNTVAGLFDIFNRVSDLSTRYTSFDPVDYHSIMQAGGCSIMGLTKVGKFEDKFAISEAVKRNLEKTLLASGFDLSTAKLAGCIVVGGKKLMAEVKGLQDNIDYAFDVLSEITGKATIHRGIYEDDKNSLRVYTVIGGLGAPQKRLEELMSCVGVHAE
jgi:cell division GTPase FtsZ